MTIKRFTIIEDGKEIRIHTVAGSRAGLIVAALQGVFAAAQPAEIVMPADDVEHQFKLTAADFPALFVAVIDEAVKAANAKNQRYMDIKFTLITDTRAEGAFAGHPALGYGKPLRGITPKMEIKKNDRGEWETTLMLA